MKNWRGEREPGTEPHPPVACPALNFWEQAPVTKYAGRSGIVVYTSHESSIITHQHKFTHRIAQRLWSQETEKHAHTWMQSIMCLFCKCWERRCFWYHSEWHWSVHESTKIHQCHSRYLSTMLYRSRASSSPTPATWNTFDIMKAAQKILYHMHVY